MTKKLPKVHVRINMETGEIEEIEEPKELNEYCYFCDFNLVRPHQHHIIRLCDGGEDIPSNRLPLCANHHELIHRRVCVLMYNPKTNLYFLKNRINGEITKPTKRQVTNRRKLPYSSIKYSKNLIVEGDLNSKGKIKIKDYYKKERRHQKKVMKEMIKIKKLKKEVCNEKGVQSE